MEAINEFSNKKNMYKAKKKNAKLFAIYKAFSWDLLFFYSIEYLFFTQVKGFVPGNYLKLSSLFPIFIILFQLPSTLICDALERKKSIILGNILTSIYVAVLITIPGAKCLIIGSIFHALGYNLKTNQETSLLYDSTATRGGEGLFSKINSKGAVGYYIIEGISALISGYLFVINGYIPMILCFMCTVIATIISFNFKDIYTNKMESQSIKNKIIEYKKDFSTSLKKILKSKRMRALIMYMIAFRSLESIMETYRGNILVDFNVKTENFTIILGTFTLLAGLAAKFQDSIHKKFRNKTLGVLALTYTISLIIIGFAVYSGNKALLPLVIVCMAIMYMACSNYFVLMDRYSKNFSTPKTSHKVSSVTIIFVNVGVMIFSLLAGDLLNLTNIGFSTLFIGLSFLILFLLILDYMKTRVGLKPNQYKKDDINFD